MHAFRLLSGLLLLVGMAGPAAALSERWSLEALADALAQAPRARVSFVERRYTPYLTEPVVLHGYLARPEEGRLEKHVTTPEAESFIILEDEVRVRREAGRDMDLRLSEHPALLAVAAALRAVLAGRLDELRPLFSAELVGVREGWTLHLRPVGGDLRAALREMRINGAGGRIEEVAVARTDGSRSVMQLSPER